MTDIPDTATRTEFYHFFDKIVEKYIFKLPQYGESWRGMTIQDLRARFVNEYNEWNCIPNPQTPDEDLNEARELIDVAVCAFLLYTRLMENSKNV
jgi:hypothetical protein